MDTQVRTPQAIFMQPQRLLVPLFQRPYVWNEEQQWEPLWRDLERVATKMQMSPGSNHQPHFLGAVVFQQVSNKTSDLQQRTVIDGQQRLTTLQLMLDALHAEISLAGVAIPAARLEPLIRNADAFCKNHEDMFKVWPTNKDRDAFNEVMASPPPVAYDSLAHKSSRLVKAHQYFAERCKEWLQKGDNLQSQAETIERSARELLQIVVIDLAANENAQEIFETLNARGSQLTAADLIKNFVFQKLLESKADVEAAYSKYWIQFETAFWELEVSVGRVRHPRSSVFLNHWLIANTGEEVLAREVFSEFKIYADSRQETPMPKLLLEIHRASEIYRKFIESAEIKDGPLDRLSLFAYRAKTLESEVVKPVVLALLDSKKEIAQSEIELALDVIESWLTRRMLIRATTKMYNQIMADVVRLVRSDSSGKPGTKIQNYFATQKSESSYWPDDKEIRKELREFPIYRKLSRARLRMVLEAIEDLRRGWISGQTSAAGMRIRRDSYAIEHVMPQSWEKNWAQSAGVSPAERDARIHQLGNLSLLTKKLNSTVSNGPWLGPDGKAAHFQEKDVLLLNNALIASSLDGWDEKKIDQRTVSMIDEIIRIWPVPAGHNSDVVRKKTAINTEVSIADLLSADYLVAGQTLYASPKFPNVVATILPDGRIDVSGQIFDTPSGAGQHVRKMATNGWHFWLVVPSPQKRLRRVRKEYLESISSNSDDLDDNEDDAD
jgi:hypothetical protein